MAVDEEFDRVAGFSGGNTDENTEYPNLRPPWKKGESGNPNGRPQKKRVTELYERLLDDAEVMDGTFEALRKMLRKPNMAMVLQLREMADRTEGKVTQPIAADLSVNLADAIAEARKRAGK